MTGDLHKDAEQLSTLFFYSGGMSVMKKRRIGQKSISMNMLLKKES